MFLINIKEVRTCLSNIPSLSSNSWISVSINEVLPCSYLKSMILFNDNTLLNCNDSLFNSWNECSRTIDEPFISWESFFFVFRINKVSNAFNSQSRVMRNCSVWLIILLKNLINLKWERFLPLFMSSNLNLTEFDLWLSKRCHDNFTFIISYCWISNHAVISRRNMNHFDWSIKHSLMIFEDKELRTNYKLSNILIQVLDMNVFIC